MSVDSAPPDDDSETTNGDRVLDALGDEVCRRILAFAVDEAVTVEQLADACGVSESTIYRRLNELAELGLVEKTTNIPSVSSSNAYRTRTRSLAVAIDADGFDVRQRDAEGELRDAIETVDRRFDLRGVNFDATDETVTVELAADEETFAALLELVR